MEFQPIKPDTKQPEYIQFPRFLNEISGLSLNAKAVYMLIYDRTRQGIKNKNFMDKDGSSFCFFSNEELKESLGLSTPTITRAISELKEKGLLRREKYGSNKTKMFVNVPVHEEKIDQADYKKLITQTEKIDQADYKKLITPFLYISKNKEQEQLTREKEEVSQQSEPKIAKEKFKKKSKAQEATKTVIEHWNKNYQTKYSSESKGTIKLVDAILKSGYQLDQILQVIDYKAKARRTEADYKWFVPATVLALKNFERNYQFMINDQVKPQTRTVYGSQPNQGYRKNTIPESVTLPEWYQVKEQEQASESDVKKILELQSSILKGA